MITARDQAAKIRSREMSAVEALDAALARIAALNPSLNAVVSIDEPRARRLAEAADAAIGLGAETGPLHGVPITLKDGMDVAGLRTTIGTDVFDRVADEDSTVAARLAAAGAIVIGHTNVPPFLADYQSANPIFGRTSNPWDLGRTPGGSSGGAAAAVAAGLSPLEVGSDLTGSLRLPASFCGVYALKTTEHRIPLTGFYRQPPGVPRSARILASLGPIARDLDDLDLALAILAGPDGRDPDIPPVPATSPPVSVEGLRVAVAEALPGATVGSAMRGLVDDVAGRLDAAGAHVERRLPDVDWPGSSETFMRLLGVVTEIFAPGNDLDDEQRSVAWYLTALDRRDAVVAAWTAFFEDVDALILPAAMGAAFRHAEPYGMVDLDGRPVSYLESGSLLVFANFAGLPALAAPAGEDSDGLPLGIQLVGPRWSDGRLIAAAREMEDEGVLPGFRAPPGSGSGRGRRRTIDVSDVTTRPFGCSLDFV
jgi:amidase